jgi:hypothetical protein
MMTLDVGWGRTKKWYEAGRQAEQINSKEGLRHHSGNALLSNDSAVGFHVMLHF